MFIKVCENIGDTEINIREEAVLFGRYGDTDYFKLGKRESMSE